MKRITKVLILIGVAMVVLTAVFAVSFNHADHKASAEVSTIELDTEYSFDTSLTNVSSSWTGTNNIATQTIRLSDNYNIKLNENTYITNSYIFIYRSYVSSSRNITIVYDFADNATSAFAGSKYIRITFSYANNQWSSSIEAGQKNGTWGTIPINSLSVVFKSLTIMGGGTAQSATYLSYFISDIKKLLVEPILPPNTITLESGYYLINPNAFNELDTSENFDLKARVCQIEYGALGEIPNPLTMSESVNLYDYVVVSVGSGLWIGDDETLDDVMLYNAQSGALQGRFIHATEDTTIDSKYEGLFVAVPWDLLGYNAYPIAIHYYDTGANDGILNGTTSGVISAIFDGLFGKIFAVEIFPGFPLYIFILIPVVFTILSLVLWLMRGR